MSDPAEKFQHGLRRWRNESAIKRQVKIAKTNHAFVMPEDEAHRYNKKHAMNCGDPKCHMCGNPRKFFDEQTIQEKRFEQDIDQIRDRKSNGTNSTKGE